MLTKKKVERISMFFIWSGIITSLLSFNLKEPTWLNHIFFFSSPVFGLLTSVFCTSFLISTSWAIKENKRLFYNLIIGVFLIIIPLVLIGTVMSLAY